MNKINDKELKEINGGLLKLVGGKLLAVIGAGITFIVGVVNGHLRLKWQDLRNIVFTGNSKEKRSTQIH